MHSPWLTVVGLSIRTYLQAYARMMLAYVALFVPLVAAGRSSASTDDPLPPISATREAVVAVLVLLAKLALELWLVLAWKVREGELVIFGKPVVFRIHST